MIMAGFAEPEDEFLDVSKSDSPCEACRVIAAARICGGMPGRPFADGYMSANIAAGNSSPRCSARNANTLPAGIRPRQVSHPSGPTVSPAHTPIATPRVWPRR
ncbi:hypothetical protein GCM10023220_53720 [Streptomyces ziwulingensis]|uniref:Uncharacterized protein n=1 Tax=Streptomyces ziwulingensis TaxID=1045501 RepID=A0ABP9CNC1_9ACTN